MFQRAERAVAIGSQVENLGDLRRSFKAPNALWLSAAIAMLTVAGTAMFQSAERAVAIGSQFHSRE